MVYDKEGKPRGYAFVEFERESDMRAAYKNGDGKKVDGRRVLVDVERGRTVRNWRPRRFAGGLGGTRKGSENENERGSGRVRSGGGDDRRGSPRAGDRDRRGSDRDRDRDRERGRGRDDKDRGKDDRRGRSRSRDRRR